MASRMGGRMSTEAEFYPQEICFDLAAIPGHSLLIDPTEDPGNGATGECKLILAWRVGKEGKTHNEPLRVGALTLVSPNTQAKSLETQHGTFRRECYVNFG